MRTAYEQYDAMVRAVPPHIKVEVDLEFAVSDRIDFLMQERGLSKKQLADALGRRPSEIAKWLSGQHNCRCHEACQGRTYNNADSPR